MWLGLEIQIAVNNAEKWILKVMIIIDVVSVKNEDYYRLCGPKEYLNLIIIPTFLTTKIDYNLLLFMEPAGEHQFWK